MTPRAEEIATTILRICQSSKQWSGPHLDELSEKIGDKHGTKQVIDNFLIPMNYLNKSEGGQHYEITELGKNYLTQQEAGTSMSFGDNTNFAYNSPGATQSINISELPEDIQEKIQELKEAIAKKDASAMKRAFSYIADKSVDVAIAAITGALII